MVNRKVNIRSYEVTTEDGGQYRRNRKHLRPTKEVYIPNDCAFANDESNVPLQLPSVELDQPTQSEPICTTVPKPTVPKPPEQIPTPIINRPKRQINQPVRFKDYITG